MFINKRTWAALGLSLFLLGCTNKDDDTLCVAQPTRYVEANFEAEALTYSGSTKPSDKSLVIFPPTGGTNWMDRSYAQQFCRAGYDVYILNDWNGAHEKSTDLELHQHYYTQGQKALSLIFEKIPSKFIGLLGTSLGALHSSIAVSTAPQLSAAFLIVGGAPIAEVVVNSNHQDMRALSRARYERYHFRDDHEYLEALEHAFQLEPMSVGNGYRSKDIGMVIGSDDQTVPVENQEKLRSYWNPRQVTRLSGTHIWVIVKTWLFHSQEVVNFFESSYKSFSLDERHANAFHP